MSAAAVAVASPRFEHHRDALGIGEPSPRLSWRTTADPGWTQAAYELLVERHGDSPTSSGRVSSSEQVLVDWPFRPLESRERAVVRVRVWGQDGTGSTWSPPSAVEAGLLHPSDWSAVAVGADWDEDTSVDLPPPLLRREFRLEKPVTSARAYVTAHGVVDLEINGRPVGDHVLTPGWTSYDSRLRYVTHDVTRLLVEGENAIGAWLGDGWYRGRLGFLGGTRNIYGDRLALLLQLEVTHPDGTTSTVGSDALWRSSTGPILTSGIYDGERHDARREPLGWSTPRFDATAWTGVRVVPRDPTTLVAPQGPPVRRVEEIAPIDVHIIGNGRLVVDFGQNITGRLRIRVRGDAGQAVRIRHAEVLQDGELYTRPLRGAAATDEYTLRGGGTEVWEPRFTFHGFRYAEIEGWTGGPVEENVVARVTHSDLERTGWFSCSDPLVNRLHENIRWSMRDNFLDIPTDCPQRDERLGWTGDVQVFAGTASFLYDCAGFLSSWLRDLAVEQEPDGAVPWYVPTIPGGPQWTPVRPGAVWGDAAVLTPWTLYERFGDVGVLAAQYESACAWVNLVERLAGEDRLWNDGFQLGDWLDPTAPPEDPAASAADRYLVATAYFAWSARHLATTAEVLGRREDARRYGQLANEVQAALVAEYVTAGMVRDDAQTSYALLLAFDLLASEEDRRTAGKRLAQLIQAGGNRIATGFAGTPVICDALSTTGQLDAAYALLLERECPSWLYTVLSGGTTIWERWDSMLPDGRVNPGDMTSFNHYALGAVGDWLHRVVAGLAPEEPGYRVIRFAPRPGGGLTSASACLDSAYGRTEISWHLDEGALSVSVTVPTGARGIVDLPGGEVTTVGPGVHAFAVAWEPR